MSPSQADKQVNDYQTQAAERAGRLLQLLEMDPGNEKMLAEAFEEALRGKAWELAIRCIDKAKSAGADEWVWALQESNLLLAQDQFAAAIGLLEPLLKSPAQPPEFLRAASFNMAYGYFQLGDYARVVALLNETLLPIEEAPMEAQRLWIRTLHRLGELEALKTWGQALQAAGRLQPEVAGLLSLAALDLDDLPLARAWTQIARSQGDESLAIEALASLASVALADQDVSAALAWSNQALARSPKQGRVWSIRAFGHMLAGAMNEARADFTRALSLQPEHLGTWQGLGWLCISLGDVASAEKVFRGAIEQDRTFSESHGGLAVALAAQGRREEAASAIDLALGLDANCLSAKYAQALLSGSMNSPEDVSKRIQEIIGDGAGNQRQLAAAWARAQRAARAKAH